MSERGVRLGLTGGIGCGKSTAGEMLVALGWSRLDADQLVRDLLESDPAVHAALRERWGEGVLTAAGSANRAVIAEKVFGAPEELRWLESLLHPRVRETWTRALEEHPERDWVVEIPLLFEKSLEGPFDRTVCVAAPEAVQLARLAAKGLDATSARARMRQQLPVADKVRRADHVLSNTGSFEFLRRQAGCLSGLLRRYS